MYRIGGGLLPAPLTPHAPPTVSRAKQDDYATASQQRAAKAQASGLFSEEIVPVTTVVEVNDEEKEVTVTADEGIRCVGRRPHDAAPRRRLPPTRPRAPAQARHHGREACQAQASLWGAQHGGKQ